ncbi:MAG: 30S ribosome-binding factor RbfA [Gemmatimonadales bacterium]
MTKARKYRPERLAALVQESLARALATELKDPRVGFATITGVTVSADGSHATIRVGVMGTDVEKERAMKGLLHARGFLRSHLARTLRIRSAPELHIVLDHGLEHATRIDAILRELKHDEPIS